MSERSSNVSRNCLEVTSVLSGERVVFSYIVICIALFLLYLCNYLVFFLVGCGSRREGCGCRPIDCWCAGNSGANLGPQGGVHGVRAALAPKVACAACAPPWPPRWRARRARRLGPPKHARRLGAHALVFLYILIYFLYNYSYTFSYAFPIYTYT